MSKKEINILITRQASDYYGAEMCLVNYFKLLESRLGKIILLSDQPKLIENFKNKIKDSIIIKFWWGREITGIKSIVFFVLTYPIFFFLLGIILAFQKVTNKTNLLFINSMNEKLILPIWAKLLGIKVVFIEHGTYMEFWKKIHLDIILNILSPLVDKVICVSDAVLDSFNSETNYGKKLCLVINGVDVDNAQSELLSISRQEARKKIGVSDRDFVIGYVGRIEEEKRPQHIIHAVSKLKDEIPSIKACLIGDGKEMSAYKELAKKLGVNEKVLFLGRSFSTPWYLYKAADIWVQPSHHEGLSFVALEASIARLPIIASDIPGLRELIENGKTGLLFEKGNVEELASEITILYKDKILRNNLGLSAFQTVSQNFSIQVGADKVFNLMNDLVR